MGVDGREGGGRMLKAIDCTYGDVDFTKSTAPVLELSLGEVVRESCLVN